jgi:hypothetical protein
MPKRDLRPVIGGKKEEDQCSEWMSGLKTLTALLVSAR